MDPFCVLTFNEKVLGNSSAHRGGDTNPTWNTVFSIRVHDGVASLPNAHIVVYIAHPDPNIKKLKHRHIGTAVIPLSEFAQNNSGPGVAGNWREIPLNVRAADGANPGDTPATINVRLQKIPVTAIAAADTSTGATEVAASSSTSSSDLIQIFIGGFQMAMEMAKLFYGVS